jgi:hypothetical protein
MELQSKVNFIHDSYSIMFTITEGYYATSQKAMGSVSNEVIGFFLN